MNAPPPGHLGSRMGSMVDSTGSPEPMPGMDPEEPVPDDPGELTEPDTLPPAPIESTPDDPGGDPSEQPAPA